MREAFLAKTYRPATLETIAQANTICADYARQGYDLTLRQVYYQFVARGLSENTDRAYKRLGSILNDARLTGDLDWSYIVDRTRGLAGTAHAVSPQQVLEDLALGYDLDKWVGQDYRLEVWVEKEALAGIVSRTAEGVDIDYFSCRGYVSQSAMYSAATRLAWYARQGQTPIVLHLGDHDPSGIDMSRDIRDRLHLLAPNAGPFEVVRIALNMDQIEALQPPPNPTKMTDSRAADYVAEYGYESWELDALEPAYLDRLIQEHVAEYIDQDLYDERSDEEESDRARLRAFAAGWDE